MCGLSLIILNLKVWGDGGAHRRSGSELSLSVLCMAVFVHIVVCLVCILLGEQHLLPACTHTDRTAERTSDYNRLSLLPRHPGGNSQDPWLSVDYYPREEAEAKAAQGQA